MKRTFDEGLRELVGVAVKMEHHKAQQNKYDVVGDNNADSQIGKYFNEDISELNPVYENP
jgi:hypothetical protein